MKMVTIRVGMRISDDEVQMEMTLPAAPTRLESLLPLFQRKWQTSWDGRNGHVPRRAPQRFYPEHGGLAAREARAHLAVASNRGHAISPHDSAEPVRVLERTRLVE